MQIGIIGKALHFGPCRVILTSLNILLLLMASYLFRPIADCAPIINIDGDVAESGDGHTYKVENGSFLDGMAKKAFMSLQSQSYIEPPLLTPDQKRIKWLQRYIRKQLKHDKKGKKLLSSPKEAIHQINHEVNIGRLVDFRGNAQCEGQIFKQRIRMDGCLSKVKLDCPLKNPKELIRKVVKVKKCSCKALSVGRVDSDDDDR